MKNTTFFRKLNAVYVKVKCLALPLWWRVKHVQHTSSTHSLPGTLIVSLTSYSARFRYLTPTLKSLLSQSIKPDKVILFVSKQDYASLPKSVLKLQDHGLEIETCVDIGSYTKIIPALKRYPGTFIATADDDIIYGEKWLEAMALAYSEPKEIVFHRGHFITVDGSNTLPPYSKWNMGGAKCIKSKLNFPTGVGGVLYPPRVFDQRVLDEEMFLRIAPTADDLWLFWMARLGGAQFRRVSADANPLIKNLKAQETGLSNLNNGPDDLNTKQIRQLESEYGSPIEAP